MASNNGIHGVKWTDLIMTFKISDPKFMIRGDPTLMKTEISLKMMTQTWTEHDQGYLYLVKLCGLSMDP